MASVTEMLAMLGWETLEVIRSKIRLAMFYKILNSLTAIKTTHLIIKTNSTRTKHALTIFQRHTMPSYYHYSFYPYTIPCGMPCLASTLVEAEFLDIFKVELEKQKKTILSNY